MSEWNVHLTNRVVKVHADRWEITKHGDLIFFADKNDKDPFQAFAAGVWLEIQCWG